MTRIYTPEQKARKRETDKQWAQENIEHKRRYHSIWRRLDLCRFLLWNTKGNARTKGRDFALTREWLEPRLNSGICEMTGLPFSYIPGTRWRKNPFFPSIDRRDPDRGYTEENCRLVLYAYNTAKGTWTDEETLVVARALVSASER